MEDLPRRGQQQEPHQDHDDARNVHRACVRIALKAEDRPPEMSAIVGETFAAASIQRIDVYGTSPTTSTATTTRWRCLSLPRRHGAETAPVLGITYGERRSRVQENRIFRIPASGIVLLVKHAAFRSAFAR